MTGPGHDADTVLLARVPAGPVDDPTATAPLLVPGRHRRDGSPVPTGAAIFHDGSGRRRRRLTWALGLAALGALVYTVALAASMLGGVEAESTLPRPGNGPTTAAPAGPPSATPGGGASSSARPPRGPAAEVRTRAARPAPSGSPARSARPARTVRPSPRPTTPSSPPEPTAEAPGSFWSSLFPSPRG